MLASVSSLLGQCARRAAFQAPALSQLRSLATSSALWQTPSSVPNSKAGDARRENSFITELKWAAMQELVKVPQTTKTPEEIWASWEADRVAYLPDPPTVWSGRSIPVSHDGRMPFALMSRMVQRASLRRTWRDSKFHVRAGEARNRRRSTHWRKLFAHEVRKKVQLVQKIRVREAHARKA